MVNWNTIFVVVISLSSECWLYPHVILCIHPQCRDQSSDHPGKMTFKIFALLSFASFPSSTRHCVAINDDGVVPYITVARAYVWSASWGWAHQSICWKWQSFSATIICQNIFSMSVVTTYWCFQNLVRMEKMSSCTVGPLSST